MTTEINRRTFIGTAAAAATAFTIVPRAVLGQGHVPPSDKITLAHVGFGTEAIREVASLLEILTCSSPPFAMSRRTAAITWSGFLEGFATESA